MSKPKKRNRKARPLYRVADLQRLDRIAKHLDYPNRMVAAQAQDDMRKFIAEHGEMSAGLMLAHLSSGDPIADGPCVGAGAASMAPGVGHA